MIVAPLELLGIPSANLGIFSKVFVFQWIDSLFGRKIRFIAFGGNTISFNQLYFVVSLLTILFNKGFWYSLRKL